MRCPGGFSGWAVGGEPGADAGCVDELEDEGEEPDQGMNGGHGGLQEGEHDSAVRIMNDLYSQYTLLT